MRYDCRIFIDFHENVHIWLRDIPGCERATSLCRNTDFMIHRLVDLSVATTIGLRTYSCRIFIDFHKLTVDGFKKKSQFRHLQIFKKKSQFRHLIWKWPLTLHTRPILTQVWWSWVRVLWWFRISVRFGSVRSEYRAGLADPNYTFGPVTRDCG